MADDEGLLRVRDVLPVQYQSIFGHDTFNHMQSLLVNQALNTSMNMVVAAPTGCGKTAIHELAIVRLMMKHSPKQMKIVYVAPNKALCQQKVDEWTQKFGSFGLSILEVTGDIEFKYCLQMVAKATIIVTTPEKWDSLTRSWRDHVFLLGAVDLLLIDEVHHLGEDRGSTLEIVVVRMRLLNSTYLAKKRQHNSSDVYDEMRIIALSATLPNLSDIGEWIHCDPSAVHYFDESFRPVPLTIHTLGLGNLTNPFLFERSLDDKVAEVVQRYSGGKQTLIFCSSKKSTESLAALLAKQLGVNQPTAVTQVGDGARINSLQDTHLRQLAQIGYAYHHSGLAADDRAAIEQLYLSGYITVLCSTSTLAHGVNLPAHLVIIKGTNCWRGGSRGYEKMNRSEIIQMLGRAGRPGFDTEGVAVIMTSAQDRDHYAAISLSAEVVESTLQSMLTEAICAEVSQNVICSLADCMNWIKSTYFYVRVKANPAKYKFPVDGTEEQRDSMLRDICSSGVHKLYDSKIIDVSVGPDAAPLAIQPKPETHIMSRNMIRFDTMRMLVRLPATHTLPQLLRDFSTSIELSKPVRKLEKRILNDLLRSIRFPLRANGQAQSSTRVQEPWQKAFVLMQAAVSRLDLKDFSLRVEQSEIVECGLRVLSALAELCRTKAAGPLLEHTILLDRALRVRCWDYNYGSVFTQCLGLTDPVRNGLTLNCVRTENDVEGCTISKVQSMAHCSASEAKSILHFANILRMSKLTMKVIIAPDRSRLTVTFNPVVVTSESSTVQPLLPLDQIMTYQLLCYDTASSILLLYRRIDAHAVHQPNSNLFSVAIPTTVREVRCCLLGNLVGNDSCRVFTNSPTGETIISPKPTPVVTDLSAKYNKGSISSSSNNCGVKKTAPSGATAKTSASGSSSSQQTDSVSAPSPSQQTQLRILYQPIAKSRPVVPTAAAAVPATPSPITVSGTSATCAAAAAGTAAPFGSDGAPNRKLELPMKKDSSSIDFDALLKMLECPATPPPEDPSVRAFLNNLEPLPPTPPSSPAAAADQVRATLSPVPVKEQEEVFLPRVTVVRRQPPIQLEHWMTTHAANVPTQQAQAPPSLNRHTLSVPVSSLTPVMSPVVSRDLSLLRSKASEMGFSPSSNVKRLKRSAVQMEPLQQQHKQEIMQHSQASTKQNPVVYSAAGQSPCCQYTSPIQGFVDVDMRESNSRPDVSRGSFFNMVSGDVRNSFNVDGYFPQYSESSMPPSQTKTKPLIGTLSPPFVKLDSEPPSATVPMNRTILRPTEQKKSIREELFDACF